MNNFFFLFVYMYILPRDQLKSKLSSIVDFTFKGAVITFIRLANNGAA